MKKFLAIAVSLILVCCMVAGLAACKPNTNETAKKTGDYTYNIAMSVFPTNWNPHTSQTETDSTILDYTLPGLYAFDYNEAKDGYKLLPEMATAEPVDVTSEYVGKYGVAEGDTAKVYKIAIRDDLKWQDGTPIKAADFVTSAQLLLAPKAVNYRADMFYSGSMVIVNSEEYSKSGRDIREANSADGDTMKLQFADFVKGDDGAYTTPEGKPVYFGLKTGYKWMSDDSLEVYHDAGYISEDVWTALTAGADDDGYTPVTDETIAALYTFTGSDVWGNETQDMLGYYISYDVTYPDVDWSEVGMFATGENEFVIALTKSLKGFNLLYSLSDSWLVHETLYKQCEKLEDDVYTNTYGTSTATTMSYGPYKLVDFQSDKIILLEKNDTYYGYNDEAKKDLYQTTKVQIDFVPEASTRLEKFLNGELDSYGLSAEDMEAYAKSDFTYYTTLDSTFFMAFNPDFAALKTAQENAGAGKNKTIITVPEFRMAMSFALNRAEFCLATSPTNNAAFAVYSSFIISDPETGTAYRTTDVAKQVVANFWKLSDDIGEGKLYPTIDDAIDSLTGYNLTKAQELFNSAYDKAVADGFMAESDVVEIKIGLPNNTSSFYNKGYEFLVNNYTEAVKGTKLEGKLVFTKDDSLGNAFSDALKANQVDMLFGVGWTGSALDPYNLMEAYTSENYQYDPAWNTKNETLTTEIDGVEYKASVWDWTEAIMGEEVILTSVADDTVKLAFKCGSADEHPELRLAILAELENAVLETYDMIPMMDDSNANLKGMQIKYYTEDYIYGVGRGGVKYMTYAYTDAEWSAYVKAQGGTLNYK